MVRIETQFIIFKFHPSKASVATEMGRTFLQIPRRNHAPPKPTMTGHLSPPAQILNLQTFSLLRQNFLKRRLTDFSKFGRPHSFLTMTFHLLSITNIFTSRLTRFSLATSSGKTPLSSTTAPLRRRPALPSGRPRNTTFGIGIHVKSSRTSLQTGILTAISTTPHTRNSMKGSGSTVI